MNFSTGPCAAEANPSPLIEAHNPAPECPSDSAINVGAILQAEQSDGRFKPSLDLVGKTFGRLLVLNRMKGGKWMCQCACGKTSSRSGTHLVRGWAFSCGCIRAVKAAERRSKFGPENLTHSALLSALHYEPSTGIFTWLRPTAFRCKVGDIACRLARGGYRTLQIGGRTYQAHRVAWFYVHGHWPVVDIDHKNLKRADNRIDNLREADASQNRQNTTLQRNNTTGLKGVVKVKNRWVAQINIDRKAIRLGSFKTPEAAASAYLDAKRRLHPFYVEGQGVRRD